MGGGIRPRPYSTDFNINEMTYAATNNTGAISQPHGIGFVWATMLWDLTWALIDKHGMDPDVYNGTGGNNIAMHLVIQGLKLQGCNPGFVDGRDAILQADQLLYNGENTCLIWEVFANRGLGFSADQGSRNSRTDQTEAFDLPPFVGSTYSTETITACESYTWPTNNQEYTTSGSYNAYLLNENGCDSIVTLDLTITASETSTITEVACGSYTWSANNQTYSNSGVYTETLTAVSGCDSIVTLDLTISNSQSSTVTKEVCGSYTWSANSQTYTTSGVYTETLATIEGCDSVVTLDLTISGQAVSTTVTEEVCGSYTWSANNQTYTSSGVYTETLATVEGCDSVVTLDLTINNQSVSTTVTEEVCGSYTWSANNQTYTSSGVYTETLATVEGCDSIVTLDLTIMDIVTDLTIDFENNALVSSPNYSSYQWVNCDENYAPISGEVNSTFTPSSNGNYAVIITNGNCVDTSACMRINILDLYNHEKNSMKIYPNPTGGLVKIEFVEPFSQGKISVYEMTGKLVQEFNIENQKQFQFILEGETGVYIIEHQTALGIVNRQRITKLN